MSLFIVGIDITIVNVALPSIGQSFHASVSELQWTVGTYTLVLAGLLLLSGSMADRFGRRRLFVIGLSSFVVGSLLCSLATSLPMLVLFRALQAVGGSMLNPVAMSIITDTFRDPKERAQAVGVWGAVVGISMALGPVLGGFLVNSIGWRSIFWINVPIGCTAIYLTLRYVPESKAPVPRRLDPLGQLLVMAFLSSLTYGIIEFPGAGFHSNGDRMALGVAALSIVAFILVEPHRIEPLIDLRFFRSRPFSGATAIAVTAFACFAGFLFLNTLYLQDVRGLSALRAGLDTMPMAAMAMILPPFTGWMVGRHGARLPLVFAGVSTSAGGLMLTRITPTTSFSYLFLSYVVVGIGFGLVNAPVTATAVSGMPRAQAGVAAGIASTSRQIGSTLGVAIVGALVTLKIHNSIHHDLAEASHRAWFVIAIAGVIIAVIGAASTSARSKESAARVAAILNPEQIIR